MANICNITFRVNDSKNKAVCSHQKISWQSRSETVGRMLSTATGESHFPPGRFVLQSPRANKWIWRDHMLWLVNTPSLTYARIFGYFFNFKCWLANKPLGNVSLFPWRKLLPQQSKTKDKWDSLKQRKSFSVWKVKLSERIQRSPFVSLEEAGELRSIKRGSTSTLLFNTGPYTYTNLIAFCPTHKLGLLISPLLLQRHGNSGIYLKKQ